LPARRENIPPARFLDETRHHAPHDRLKRVHAFRIRRLERNPRDVASLINRL
jgi:hypothetical protein